VKKYASVGHSQAAEKHPARYGVWHQQPSSSEKSAFQGKQITQQDPISMVVFQNYSLLPGKLPAENIYLAVNSVYLMKPR
jgi:ABC-type nitrate/sulfonate/bicarbonate transport system ATPase subunit